MLISGKMISSGLLFRIKGSGDIGIRQINTYNMIAMTLPAPPDKDNALNPWAICAKGKESKKVKTPAEVAGLSTNITQTVAWTISKKIASFSFGDIEASGYCYTIIN